MKICDSPEKNCVIFRFSAAEVRKAVQQDQIITSSSSFCSSTISLNEIIDSVDFEEFIGHNKVFVRDPLRNVFEFPQNDVIVKSTPRKIRTEKYVLPEEYEKSREELPLHIIKCVNAYVKPWTHIRFACREDVFRDKYERKIDPLSYNHQEYRSINQSASCVYG